MGHSPESTTPICCAAEKGSVNYAITTLEGKNFPRLPCGMYTPAQKFLSYISCSTVIVECSPF